MSDNELLEQANRLELKLLPVESKNSLWGKSKKTLKKINVFFKFLGEVGESKEITKYTYLVYSNIQSLVLLFSRESKKLTNMIELEMMPTLY